MAASLLRDGARVTVQVTPRDWQRVEIPEPDESPAWGKDLAVLEGLPDIVERAFMSVSCSGDTGGILVVMPRGTLASPSPA